MTKANHNDMPRIADIRPFVSCYRMGTLKQIVVNTLGNSEQTYQPIKLKIEWYPWLICSNGSTVLNRRRCNTQACGRLTVEESVDVIGVAW